MNKYSKLSEQSHKGSLSDPFIECHGLLDTV